MEKYAINPIGVIKCDDEGARIILDEGYSPALIGLDGFSHIQVLWWFSETNTDADRSTLVTEAPYRTAPDTLGVFATRSPQRPNPIALDCAMVTYLDIERGVVGLTWLDAFDGSPVLDIKPYTPSLDRVERPHVPSWCSHWPTCYEESGDFDWENEIITG